MFAQRRFVRSFVPSKADSKSWIDNKENNSPSKLSLSHRPHYQAANARHRVHRVSLASQLIRQRSRPSSTSSRRRIQPQVQRSFGHVGVVDHGEGCQRVRHPDFIPNSSSSLTPILPRKLRRPKFRPIDSAAIAAVDPVLSGIPLAYILHSLEEIAPRFLDGISNAKAIPPTSGEIPLNLEVICGDATAVPPSHVIAAYADNHEQAQVAYFPAHALILATCCANLPPLPPSTGQVDVADGQPLSVPVVPLSIPSITMLPPLLSYLYTRRIETVLSALLPSEEDSQDGIERGRAMSKEPFYDPRKIQAIWCNASALGIFDERLYSSLEIAWEICLGASSDGQLEGKNDEDGANVSGPIEL